MDGRKVGTFGDIAIFSFAEGKNMPCFGGGAFVTSNDEIRYANYVEYGQRFMKLLDEIAPPCSE